METRRFILAISLSLLVFLIYVRFFAPQPPEQAPPAPSQQPAEVLREEAPRKPKRAAAVTVAVPQQTQGRDILIETDLLKVVVNTAGGVIKTWELKHFREADKEEVGITATFNKIMGRHKPIVHEGPLGNVQLITAPEGFDEDMVLPFAVTPLEKGLTGLSQAVYQANVSALRLGQDKPSETLILTYRGPSGISIEKRFTFHNNEYKVDVALATKGIDGYNLALGTDFGIADKISSDASGRVGLSALVDGKFISEHLDGMKGDVRHAGHVEWVGLHDKYFTAAVVVGMPGIVTTRHIPAPKGLGDFLSPEITIKEKADSRQFTLYAGPMSYKVLQHYGHGLEQLVDYGWFSILARPMFWLMTFFHSLTGNFGIAIILLTIVVRAILFYPSLKSATAMEEMKAIQPQLTALREKYKKDPQKMNQEMMRMYKEHKVNPLGGCLPMLLQLPFFVALYNVLNASVELRQAPFISFWIKDLSVYDPYYILPVLMGVSMIATMKMTATTVDPQQQKIMMFMNVAFIFLFAWLPAGLLLYITLSNVLSIVQQLYVRKLIAKAA